MLGFGSEEVWDLRLGPSSLDFGSCLLYLCELPVSVVLLAHGLCVCIVYTFALTSKTLNP